MSYYRQVLRETVSRVTPAAGSSWLPQAAAWTEQEREQPVIEAAPAAPSAELPTGEHPEAIPSAHPLSVQPIAASAELETSRDRQQPYRSPEESKSARVAPATAPEPPAPSLLPTSAPRESLSAGVASPAAAKQTPPAPPLAERPQAQHTLRDVLDELAERQRALDAQGRVNAPPVPAPTSAACSAAHSLPVTAADETVVEIGSIVVHSAPPERSVAPARPARRRSERRFARSFLDR